LIFPSYVFLLIFLPVVLAGWHGIKNLQTRLAFLTISSYVFYGWWDYRFTALLLGSTVLDYICGRRIHNADEPRARKLWLSLSIAGNLSALGFFKYFNFFADSLSASMGAIGVEVSMPMLDVVLPLGISFYTFQSMSYSIDIYRGQCRPIKDFLPFAAYVSMFPQLVAGPIVRYNQIEQQLRDLPNRRTSLDQMADGVWLMGIGLIKKIWIADRLAPAAQYLFDGGGDPQLITAWAGALAYTFQLYFDFSGYSDMARGLGKMLGFELPINFNSPYKSIDISDFWNRWHITLSNWMRDYVFIPLGGSKGALKKTLRNLVITMFLGGLWHGAAWNFVIWGLYHGVLLVVNAGWKKLKRPAMSRTAAIALTFLAVVMGWVMFRAPTIGRAFEVYFGMMGLNGIETFSMVYLGHVLPEAIGAGAVWLALAALIAFLAPNSEQVPKSRSIWAAIALAVIYLATLTQLGVETPFLYFQF